MSSSNAGHDTAATFMRPLTTYPAGPITVWRGIRVVKLLPGQFNDEIRCASKGHQLRSRFEPKTSLQYGALSYTWSTWESHRTIVSNQILDFPVTKNLWAALRRLRRTGRSRTLWIDQICIDEGSVIERSQQVRLLRDIYRQANKVIVWFGDVLDVRQWPILPDNDTPRYSDAWWKERMLQLEHVLQTTQTMWHTRSWVSFQLVYNADDPDILAGCARACPGETESRRPLWFMQDEMVRIIVARLHYWCPSGIAASPPCSRFRAATRHEISESRSHSSESLFSLVGYRYD